MSRTDDYPPEEPDAVFLRAQRDALRFLSYRARSEAEVRCKLERRYPPQIIERVLATLRRCRYLDDVSFAQEWRKHRERFRPRGKVLLQQELRRLGLTREIVDEALEGFDAGANAYRAGSKLARRLAGSDERRFRQKLWEHLRRRGFEAPVIGDTVEQLWRELAPDLLDRHDDADNHEEQPE